MMLSNLNLLRVFLIACFLAAGAPPSAAKDEVRVGTWKTAQTIQPFFYENFYSGPGKIRIFTFTNPADQKNALLAGSLDLCGTTIAHAIHSASMGQPVVVVAALCNKSSALVVGKESPIQTIADLRGKRIGYVPGTMHEILLRETLTRQGIAVEKDVVLVRVDFFDMGMALARGDLDAFLSGEPFPTLAVHQGYGRILAHPYFDETIGTINAGMLVTREMIDARRDEVQRLVSAHAATTRYLQKHPEQWLQRASEFGMSVEILRAAVPNMEPAWHMDEDYVRKARALGERMEALGIISKQPDYARLFDLSFVKEVQENLDQEP